MCCFFSDLIFYQHPLTCPFLTTLTSLNKPRTLLLQGLCISCFVGLGQSSSPYTLGSLSHFLQIFAQKSPSQWAYSSLLKTSSSLAPLCLLATLFSSIVLITFNILYICLIYFVSLLPSLNVSCKTVGILFILFYTLLYPTVKNRTHGFMGMQPVQLHRAHSQKGASA